MLKITVYVDESGTLPDPADKVVVVAAVSLKAINLLDEIFKKIKKKAPFKKYTGEIKYYTSGEKTKLLFFDLLANEDVTIYTLIVEKMGRKISDTPENYAALCLLLLTDVLNFTQNIDKLIFDRHFSRDIDMLNFNKIIRGLVGSNVPIKHVDSKRDKRVNVADMVAGAVLANETGKDTRFYKTIEGKITSYKKVNWREVKKHFMTIKKLA